MGSAPPMNLPVTRWPCTRRVPCRFCIRADNAVNPAHYRAWKWIAAQRHLTWGYEP